MSLCCSEFLYEISHPDKEGYPQVDLSTDDDIVLDSELEKSLSPKQLALERVMVKVFITYRCDVIITDRLRNLFKAKLWRMGKQLHSLGGTGRANLQEKWRLTKWKLEFNASEVVPYVNTKQNHAIVTTVTTKCKALECKLNQSNQKLKEVTNQLQILEESKVRLSDSLRGVTQSSSKRKRKDWTDCSTQYQRQQIKKVKQDVKTALSFTETENFKPLSVGLVNKNTQELIHVDCNETPVHTKDDKSVIERTLYIKDRYNISNVSYHELAMINTDLPRISTIAKASRELNAKYAIHPTPGKVTGVQQSLKERLRIRISHLLKLKPSFSSTGHVRVKITGDGTVVSRSLHVVVIAFSLMVDEEIPTSPNGNHAIALINATEDYDNLIEALEDIANEIKTLQSIVVDGVTFTIEFFLAADWKFLATIVGIEAATAKYFCIWCKCPAEYRHISGTWSIEDVENGARTIEEIQMCAKVKKRGTEKYGCIRQPIFPTIKINHIIPDILHLF